MFTRDEAQRLAEKVLSYSKYPECTAMLSASENAYVRFANNGITTAGVTLERSVTVTSARDGRSGTSRTTQIDDASLEAAVRRSEELAALAPANPEHMPPPGAQEYPRTHDFDEETAKAKSPAMIPQIRAVIDAADSAKLVSAGFFERTHRVAAVANKNKLFGFDRSTDARLSTTVRTPDGSSSGWASQPSVRIPAIRGVDAAERAVEKCLRWRKPKRLEPGKYTVILEPAAVGNLVGLLRRTLDARAAEEGRSFLSKKGGGTYLGEKLFPEIVTLRNDPLSSELPSSSWTDELLPNRPVTWIEKGVVRTFACSRYWAAKTKQEPTPDPDSLVLEGGDGTLADLIRSVERGLLVTRFWYIRLVNPQTYQLTGLTRDGVFLVENGQISTAVMNLRFNESPVRLLQSAQRLGRPVRVGGFEGGSMLAPPIAATDFSFTSVSDAV